MMHRNILAALVVATAATVSAGAQGTESAQGLGYPTGEMSTRTLGSAGAMAETDGRSPINPASLAIRPVPQLFAQYDPELRSVTSGGKTSSTTTARFPNVGATLPVSNRLVLGVNVSTFLDQSWANSRLITSQIAGEDIEPTESLRSEGAIEDIRGAIAYAVSPSVRVGLGLHGFTGSARLTARDIFTDSLRFTNLSQTTNLSYSGYAVSAGFIADLLPTLSISGSARKGGSAKMYAGDTVLTSANIPDRYSGAISFGGLAGTIFSVRASRERWTQIAPLTTQGTAAVDATDISAGLESAGPRLGGGFPILFRLGVRQRTLPFPVGTQSVKETSFGGGLGIPIAFDRVTFDAAVLRANRTGVSSITEHAYLLSFGLQVRP